MNFEWIEIVNLKINGNDNFTIWYESDDMGFLTKNKKLMIFETVEKAKEFIDRNIDVENVVEITEYNIDAIKFKLLAGIEKIDSDTVLDFWNIIIDLSNTMNLKFSGNIKNEKYNSIYNKLFFGSDIMSMNPGIHDFFPEYSNEESKILSEIVNEGIEIVEKSLRL